MKKRNLREATSLPKRRGTRTCKDCPKWRPAYCAITAMTKAANSPACQYGRDLINSAETARRAKEKAKA